MQRQGSELTNIEITDGNIRSFARIARKYGMDYSLKKDRSEDPPRYLVFFRARDKNVMLAAFEEYAGRTQTKAEKPSVRNRLLKAVSRSARHHQRERTRHRERRPSL